MSTTPFSEPPIWNLSDLYLGIDDQRINTDLETIRIWCTELVELKPALSASSFELTTWKQALALHDNILKVMTKLADYSHLLTDQDTAQQNNSAFQQTLKNKLVEMEAEVTFLPLLAAELDDSSADALAKDDVTLDYKEFIRESRRLQPHLLPTEHERLLVLTLSRERQAWAGLESNLSSRRAFGTTIIDGQTIELTSSVIMKLLEHHDTAVRHSAYTARCQAYAQENETLAYAYRELVRNMMTETRLRNYPDIWSHVSDRDDIPQAFIPNLLNLSDKRKEPFTKLFADKAHTLGNQQLHAADVLAPLNGDAELTIDWNHAHALTTSAFAKLGPEFSSLANTFFNKPWIHARPTKRKATGAYCMYAPDHPFVLMSFEGKMSDVRTLAHEVGHGIHGLLFKEHKMAVRHPGLILAETASQFGELLLLEELEKEDPKTYKIMLRKYLESSANALYQQNLITRFEHLCFEQAKGSGLTSDWLSDNWLKLKRELGQNVINYPDEERWTWARISHIFFHPFYCYTYAASQLLVFALAQNRQADPEAFIPRFRTLLAAGGSVKADELLKMTFGFGMDDGAFLSSGFDYLERLTDKYLKP